MNAERLLQNFDRLVDTPDAIPRLRRFILDLAVRGKLVPNRTTSRASSSSDDNLEQPFTIPHDWHWVTLSEVTKRIHYGYTASADHNKSDVRLLRITDIQDNRVDWSSVPGCDIADSAVMQYKLAPRDILVARTGGTIGKTFLIEDVPVKAVFASYLIRVIPSDSVSEYFLKRYMESPLYWNQLYEESKGTGQPNVNSKALGNLAIPLPPLDEQHRIAAKADEMMKLCDELEAAQAKREKQRDRLVAATLHGLNNGDSDSDASERLPFKDSARFYFNHLPRLTTRPEHIQQLRQTILNLAVLGKLVPQDPKDEPVSKVESLDVPFDLASSWRWKSIGDLGKTQTGSTPPTVERCHYNGNIPFIKPAAISYGVINYEGQGLTESGVRESTVVQAGAILMVCIGGSIGKAALVDRPVCFNQQINSVSPNEGIDSHYVLVAMQSPYFKARVVDTAAQGTLPIISKGKWERLLIPFPPLAEQHRIVAKVDELMALCDEMEARITTNTTTSRKLLEAILQEAISVQYEPRQRAAL